MKRERVGFTIKNGGNIQGFGNSAKNSFSIIKIRFNNFYTACFLKNIFKNLNNNNNNNNNHNNNNNNNVQAGEGLAFKGAAGATHIYSSLTPIRYSVPSNGELRTGYMQDLGGSTTGAQVSKWLFSIYNGKIINTASLPPETD